MHDHSTLKSLLIGLVLLPVAPLAAFSLEPAENPPQGLYENRSCQELYHAASELEVKALNFESDIYNEQNNTLASIVSTVFTPALYFVGYSKYMSFQSDRASYQSAMALDKVRYRMAEMRCFQN